MKDLLDLAIAAHGGWDRWQQVSTLDAHMTAGGTLWHVKGWPDAYADVHCVVHAHRQHTEYSPFLKAGQHGVYEPDRTSIVTDDGVVLEERASARHFFDGHTIPTPWDRQHLIYFTGYAMWTYLTTPFTLKSPGFVTQEIDPWDENGETWRRLEVTFPANVHTHSTRQVFYFDAAGLLRRHDYSVDIMGGTASAHYASDHRAFGGLVFPTKRRVYATGADNRPILDRVAISIDIHDIAVT